MNITGEKKRMMRNDEDEKKIDKKRHIKREKKKTRKNSKKEEEREKKNSPVGMGGGERNVTCSFKLRALIDVKVTPRRLLSAFSYSTHFFPLVSGSSSLSSSCYCSYPLFLFSLLLVFSPCFISSSEG